ncbi:ABC transporter substrate-binding protein [Chromatiaceae bacterium AAb-1]|jgi:phospholipid transport system substrate-binding protein|nr:ABC transporter substrate-binding protein [Chromatiaceae bacterium AAb-1]
MKVSTLIYSSLLLLGGSLLPAKAEVQTFTDPYKMIEVVADKTFTRIAKDQGLIQQNIEHLRTIVNDELVPYIDSRYAAALVIGQAVNLREHAEDFSSFVQAFQNYMVASYAGALTYYRDQKVIIEPARPLDNQTITTVKVRVIDPGKPDINVEFKLRRPKNSQNWQVYDMVAEGISLLDSKRAELSNLIRQQGLVKVTTLLTEKAKEPIKVPE